MILITVILALLIRLIPVPFVFGEVVRFNTVDAYHYVNGSSAWSSIIGLFTDHYVAASILPVVFAIGTIVLCYLITQELFNNKRVSLFSALLLSIMSGEFLVRTSLGAGDTHSLEILLLTLSIYLILKILKSDNRSILFIVPLLVTICLYALIWQGWLLVLFVAVMARCLKILITAQKWHLYLFFAVGMIFASEILEFYLPEFMKAALSVFTWNTSNTIYEAQPLLIHGGQFTIQPLFSNFGLTFCGLIGLGLLDLKRNAHILFITWIIVLLLMTLAQERFAYYLAVPLSIIAGYTFWYISQILKKRKFTQYVLYGIIVLPLLIGSVRQNMSDKLYMTDSWVETCQWLKKQPAGTVLTWWDYGYYVKDSGHNVLDSPGRPIDSNYQYKPTNEIAKMLTGVSEVKADYVIVDEAMVTTKLDHIMKFASVDDCIGLLLCRLYNDEQVGGFNEVFRSSDGKVKVYETK